MKEISVSSSLIREKCERGESLDGLVPAAVEEYIKNNALYKK